ncbi:MAG: IS66 family insertion sequence element accessory protein TnpA [Cellulosilyticaceae bacterium]
MTTQEATKTYRLNQWTQIIRECRNSGQTVKDWCNAQGIHPQQYYYWLRKVRMAATQALPSVTTDPSIVPLQMPTINQDRSTEQVSKEVVATISLGEVVIQLSNDASSELITNLLRSIQHVR